LIYDTWFVEKTFFTITRAATETRQGYHQKTIAVDQTSSCR